MGKDKRERKAVHMRLTAEAVEWLDRTADRKGINRTALVEMLIRGEVTGEELPERDSARG